MMFAVFPISRTCATLAVAVIAVSCIAIDNGWAHGPGGDHSHALRYGDPADYLWQGARHVLSGYDHLLFLLGVMFFLTGPKDIIKFITAFTVGHSITLIGATMMGVKTDVYLVDAVIAVSVIYKGFDNLDGFRRWIGVGAPHMLAMVFGFGLIHGFGLATHLQSRGLPKDGLIPRLLAFNVGVEVGQIAALVVMVVALAWIRRTKVTAPFTVVTNAFLVIAGSLLFLHQLHGYQHNAYPDDFGFSTNRHIIDHYSADMPSSGAPAKTYDMTTGVPANPK